MDGVLECERVYQSAREGPCLEEIAAAMLLLELLVFYFEYHCGESVVLRIAGCINDGV